FNHYWAGNGEYVLYLQDADGDENYRLYRVELSTGEVRDLTPFEGVRCGISHLTHDRPDELVLYMNRRNPEVFDCYVLNLVTGEISLIQENPGDVLYYDLDWNMQVRAYSKPTPDGGEEFFVRREPGGEWERLFAWDYEDSSSFSLSFTPGGGGLYLADSRGSNTLRLVLLDLATGETTVLAEDPDYDIHFGHGLSSFAFHPTSHELEAVAFYRERLEWEPLSDAVRGDIELLNAYFDADYYFSDRSRDDRTWLVTAYPDDRSPAAYVYHRDEGRVEKMFDIRPELDGYTLAPMIPITYPARDGLAIRGYLTLPPGLLPRELPLVLDVHGGPWARDIRGYSGEVQWLANRGYAVLQVNFRGSTGFGKGFMRLGDREWGGRMQDDLTDAVAWAVGLGIADPERVAVYGWSYGGYAALAGATFTPELYACAVSGIGPANLVSFIETVPPYWRVGRESFFRRVGNPETERGFLESRSPLNFVERIEIPMFLIYGAHDPRVKLSEGEQISAALAAAGITYEYVVYPDEGHGLARPENRLDAYRRIERFLADNLGGRFEE
ncbi:MAG TPA: S9 family peptidase, partial [Candidatus Coatesbacteria bacterium]|nr:S9 family peptidase [Candidatus Coatesbacteria bacterium]